jgi:hypothetical protein
MVTGILSFAVFVSIRSDLARIDPETLRDMHKFDNRLAAWFFQVNTKKTRAFMNAVEIYANQRLSLKVRVYRALGVVTLILLGGNLLAAIVMRWLGVPL